MDYGLLLLSLVLVLIIVIELLWYKCHVFLIIISLIEKIIFIYLYQMQSIMKILKTFPSLL